MTDLILARGTTLNYFRDDGKFDLFIIINEPNSDENIDKAIMYLDSINLEKINIKELHDKLEEKFFIFGCELLIKGSNKTYKLY